MTEPPVKTELTFDTYLDKRTIAYHEAGHAVVSMVKGYSSAVYVRQVDPIHQEGIFWTGFCIHNEPAPIATNLAGIVAEALLKDEACTADEVIETWQRGESVPGESDMAGLPDSWEERRALADGALEILRANRPFLDALAAELEANDTVERERVDEIAESFGARPAPLPC
ncbi:MAG: hypothetical protein Fues2KO_24130 [Fuerstiella sp.]